MELMSYIIVAVVAFWIGWQLRGIILLARFSTNPEHFIDLLQQIKKINDSEANEKLDSEGTELNIERHGTMLYAFVKDTDQFIAQGSNLEILLDEAAKRFPNRKFFGNISADNPAKEIA